MITFECKLVSQGFIKELFYRGGDSARDVKEGLEMFHWGDGDWFVTEA